MTKTFGTSARPPEGLRERRRRETRLDIARAATHLVARNGLEATTVELIAERAGVSPRTFFNYFATKAEAVLALTVDAFAVLPDLLDARPATENPIVAVREAFCQLAAITPSDAHQLKAITQSDPTLKAELDRVFEAVGSHLKGRLTARYPQDPDAMHAAEVSVAVGFALLGLAFRDSVAEAPTNGGTASGVSPVRLREYFDILSRYPLNPETS